MWASCHIHFGQDIHGQAQRMPELSAMPKTCEDIDCNAQALSPRVSSISRFDWNLTLPSGLICFLDSEKLPTDRPKSVREPLTMALRGEVSLLSDVQSCLHCTVYTSGCLQAVDSMRMCAIAYLISELWRLVVV